MEPTQRRPLDLKLILISAIVTLGSSLLIGFGLESLGRHFDAQSAAAEQPGLADQLFFAAVASPVIVYIFQSTPYVVLVLLREKLQGWFMHVYILVSAVLFSLLGLPDGSMFRLYIPGIILAYGFYRSREQGRPAFLTVALIVFLVEATQLLLEHYRILPVS
ncbi:hypothetical protein ACWKWU_14130 [Chitinophaga lutea]